MNEFGDTPRSARQRRKYFRHLLHKCLSSAFDVAASPTAQPQLQRHVRALDWKGPEVAFVASCACALTLLRSPGKRRNLAQLRRQPNDRRPGRHSEHERPAPEKTTILLASRWISAAEKSIKKAGQHAL